MGGMIGKRPNPNATQPTAKSAPVPGGFYGNKVPEVCTTCCKDLSAPSIDPTDDDLWTFLGTRRRLYRGMLDDFMPRLLFCSPAAPLLQRRLDAGKTEDSMKGGEP